MTWSYSFLTPDCFRKTCKIHWAKHKLFVLMESRSAWKASSILRVRFSFLDSSSARRLSEKSERPPRGVCCGLCPRGVRKPRGVLSAVADRSVLAGRENFGGMHLAGAGNTKIQLPQARSAGSARVQRRRSVSSDLDD